MRASGRPGGTRDIRRSASESAGAGYLADHGDGIAPTAERPVRSVSWSTPRRTRPIALRPPGEPRDGDRGAVLRPGPFIGEAIQRGTARAPPAAARAATGRLRIAAGGPPTADHGERGPAGTSYRNGRLLAESVHRRSATPSSDLAVRAGPGPAAARFRAGAVESRRSLCTGEVTRRAGDRPDGSGGRAHSPDQETCSRPACCTRA